MFTGGHWRHPGAFSWFPVLVGGSVHLFQFDVVILVILIVVGVGFVDVSVVVDVNCISKCSTNSFSCVVLVISLGVFVILTVVRLDFELLVGWLVTTFPR